MQSTKLSILLLCCALLCSLASVVVAQKKDKSNPAIPDPPPATPYSNVKRDNLLNGLQIVTLDRQSDSTVKCDLIIRGGAMFDLVGKTGMAALTQESLMIVNPRVKEELESLNAKIDWGVTWDTTWFHVEAPANNFGQSLEIVARLLVVENIRPDAFKKAREAQTAKVKTTKLTVAEQADAAFLKAIYGEHPYGHNLEGDDKSLAGINQGDAYDFFRRFYIANNASAVVTGNISQERVMQVFKVLFGGWIKGQIVPATFRQPMQTARLKLVKVPLPDAAMAELRGGLIGVKHSDADFFVTQAIACVLTNRLSRESGIGFSIKSEPRILSGPLYFSASATSDQAQDFSRRATEAFASLTSAPVSELELVAAKSALVGDYSARPIEQNLRDIEMFLLPRNLPVEIGKKIEAISAADIQRVAKRLLDANALTVVVVGKINDSFKTGL
ncbi:MAG: M16 family metallopeptidase [Blastocatellia bacterium]